MIQKYNLELTGTERIPQLVAEDTYNIPAQSLTDSDAVVQFGREVLHLEKKSEEYVYLLCIDSRGKILGVFEVSHGNVNTAPLSSREVCIRALLVGAVTMIIIHNHPSGCIDPSLEDDAVTQRLYEAGLLIGVHLLDSIIIGTGGKYYSFREEKKIILV